MFTYHSNEECNFNVRVCSTYVHTKLNTIVSVLTKYSLNEQSQITMTALLQYYCITVNFTIVKVTNFCIVS